ncbi:MtrAB system histidine kinase MtrB [Pseudoclavibacter soli]|uniref:MtrAB system histidine kinase MtrB n=1 Tax=Pseudoclavibacter soli TaxID=452623 RepID=UPI000408EC6F|nr:MtrAB system histidine kinase MtrB [Pseudoclavibacter soli]
MPRAVRSVLQWLRRSLLARATAVSLVLSLTVSVIVFGLLTLRIASQLYDARRDNVLAVSTTAVSDVKSLALASTAQDDQTLQVLKASMLRAAEATSGSQEVALLHTADSVGDLAGTDLISATLEADQIPDRLREQVRAAPDSIYWQPVSIGGETPGIMVGTTVSLPLGGDYELYIRYSLEAEQQTLSFVQWMLSIGAAVLTLASVAITAASAAAILQPIRRTAEASRRLAAGDLGQRLPQTGADEAVDLGSSFNIMADALESRITELKTLSTVQQRFVSDVSHELRTPVTTIRLAADVVYDSRAELPPRAARSAEILHAQVERFEVLLSDLLEMSRFDAGVAGVHPELTDVGQLVLGVVDGARMLADDRGCSLDVEIGQTPEIAEIDAGRIARAVRNLLANAIEHGQGRPIRVQVSDAQLTIDGLARAAVSISVIDQGVGLAPDQLTHVFDRFWRADTSRQRTLGGTGLGLAITREDVQLHHGIITVESTPGEGSTFAIILPKEAVA